VLTFIALGVSSTPLMLWIVTLIYGIFAGLGEGIERAIISDFAAPDERGTAYGWYNMVIGIAAIPAGVMFGAIWQLIGARQAFWFASAIAASAALILHFYVAAGLRRHAAR
jgi:sugar phosphate permease